jgi:hypothetical protein
MIRQVAQERVAAVTASQSLLLTRATKRERSFRKHLPWVPAIDIELLPDQFEPERTRVEFTSRVELLGIQSPTRSIHFAMDDVAAKAVQPANLRADKMVAGCAHCEVADGSNVGGATR